VFIVQLVVGILEGGRNKHFLPRVWHFLLSYTIPKTNKQTNKQTERQTKNSVLFGRPKFSELFVFGECKITFLLEEISLDEWNQ
jgi:hypothetical protein